MARARNPRRVVLEALRHMNDRQRITVSVWNVDGRVYDVNSSADAWRPGWPSYRQRRHDEYPENNRAAWKQLSRDMSYLIERAEQIRRYAEVHALIEQMDDEPHDGHGGHGGVDEKPDATA